jgi:hypothetical protein
LIRDACVKSGTTRFVEVESLSLIRWLWFFNRVLTSPNDGVASYTDYIAS